MDDDDYKLTIVLDNGEETNLVIIEKVYEMAMDGESLEVCQNEHKFVKKKYLTAGGTWCILCKVISDGKDCTADIIV